MLDFRILIQIKMSEDTTQASNHSKNESERTLKI